MDVDGAATPADLKIGGYTGAEELSKMEVALPKTTPDNFASWLALFCASVMAN
jgi:hypothetical protein